MFISSARETVAADATIEMSAKAMCLNSRVPVHDRRQRVGGSAHASLEPIITGV